MQAFVTHVTFLTLDGVRTSSTVERLLSHYTRRGNLWLIPPAAPVGSDGAGEGARRAAANFPRVDTRIQWIFGTCRVMVGPTEGV
ncbi:hypothetical protein Sros01_05040 [Streptomyces roseochromogenus]|nr:hypothetical protein Sros01_05040 [Streptomyces roseochromogenus]